MAHVDENRPSGGAAAPSVTSKGSPERASSFLLLTPIFRGQHSLIGPTAINVMQPKDLRKAHCSRCTHRCPGEPDALSLEVAQQDPRLAMSKADIVAILLNLIKLLSKSHNK